MTATLTALILAGGSGTRFWPLSRRLAPKQLLALDGERTLLQETVHRLDGLVPPESVWVATNHELGERVRQQLPEVPASQVLEEPTGRNTAPAIGWALCSMPAASRDAAVVVLPADHRVEKVETFRTVLERAGAAVHGQPERVVALGVSPSRIETGYGYLELGEVLDPSTGLRRVERFTEKPDRATAERFVSSGAALWNAGIFVFRGGRLLEHLRRLAPEIGDGLAAIGARPDRLAELYAALPSISIDYAVMERLDCLAALPLDCGWSDLGSWEALAEVLPMDDAGNAVRGDVSALDAGRNLLFASEGHVAVLGVDDLVVVRAGDVVLVAPRERSQEVRDLVSLLRQRGRDDLL